MIQKLLTLTFAIAAIGLFSFGAYAETPVSGATTLTTTPAKSATPAVIDTAAKINWMQFDVGLAKAKKEKKHLFVDFTAAWCGWCKKMDAETFSRPEVIKYVNDNFIAAKVIGDSDKELDLDGYKISERNLTTGEFRVKGFPAFAFLSPEAKVVRLLSGYRPTENMMEELVYVKERKYDTTKVATPDGSKQPEKK